MTRPARRHARRPTTRGTLRPTAAALGVAFGVTTGMLAVDALTDRASSVAGSTTAPAATAPAAPAPAAPGGPATSPGPPDRTARPGRVTLAFAGDTHFEGVSKQSLSRGDLGSATDVLAAADVGVLNLETAVGTGGNRQPKQYAFLAPPSAFALLREEGVDVVSMANNHGMDFGRAGLVESLAAAREHGMPVVGAGDDEDAAYAPWSTSVDGVRVAVLGATDVLDSFAIDSWPARGDRPGLADTKGGEDRFLDAVAEAARTHDVVAVVIHWGVERTVCPTPRQRELAAALVRAGADVVVGSHAHVLQPLGEVDGVPVMWGAGNYHFYARPGPAAQTGVLTVVAGADGVRDVTWHPARIGDGRPQLLSGASAREALADLARTGERCG